MTPTDSALIELAQLIERAAREWVTKRNASLQPWQKQRVSRPAPDVIQVTVARSDRGPTSFDVVEIHVTEKRDGDDGEAA
jgi:hypothetical protein